MYLNMYMRVDKNVKECKLINVKKYPFYNILELLGYIYNT